MKQRAPPTCLAEVILRRESVRSDERLDRMMMKRSMTPTPSRALECPNDQMVFGMTTTSNGGMPQQGNIVCME